MKLKTISNKKALKKASKTKYPFVYDNKKGFFTLTKMAMAVDGEMVVYSRYFKENLN